MLFAIAFTDVKELESFPAISRELMERGYIGL